MDSAKTVAVRRLTDEQADRLTLLWLESRDLSSLADPEALVEMYFDVFAQIKPQHATQSRPKNQRRVLSKGI